MLNSLRSLNSKQWLADRGGNQDSGTTEPVLSTAVFPPASSCSKGDRKARTMHWGLQKELQEKFFSFGLKKEKGGPGVWEAGKLCPYFYSSLTFLPPQLPGRPVAMAVAARQGPQAPKKRPSLTWQGEIRIHMLPPLCLLAAWPWKQKELPLYSLSHGL